MSDKNIGIWIFSILSIGIFLVWDYFFIKPLQIQEKETTNTTAISNTQESDISASKSLNLQNTNIQTSKIKDLKDELNNKNVININSKNFTGIINLEDGKIDYLLLKDYNLDLNSSEKIIMLNPKNTLNTSYITTGLLFEETDDSKIAWQSNSQELTDSNEVILTKKINQNLIVIKTIKIHNNYLLKVTDKIINNTGNKIEVTPYSSIVKTLPNSLQDTFISHEGIVFNLKDTFETLNYEDINDKKEIILQGSSSFAGFSDKYWLTSLISTSKEQKEIMLRAFTNLNNQKAYQLDYTLKPITINKNSNQEFTNLLYIGPKEYRLINKYNTEYNIDKFDFVIDYGWFFFLVKPMYKLFLFLDDIFGNFGFCILVLTLIVRLVLFPFAYKSYISMNKMKLLQPKLKALKEKYKADTTKYNSAVMEFYKKEKINPLAGCLPVLLQIPIFFSLYKVIFLSIEIRHQPFWGWIKDLSSQDPTTIVNLFGLIPFNPPSFLHLGIWPILMGVTMFIQQKQSMTTMDEMQRKIFMFMPLILTFVLAGFPSALLIYWTFSNVLAILQQFYINHKTKTMGLTLPKNTKSTKR